MRVKVTGYMLDDNVIAADTLNVLSLAPTPAPGKRGRHAPPPVPRYAHTGTIRLRGTVVSVDDNTGRVVVRVNDHTRAVRVDENTDLTDITAADDSHIGVAVGDRITVSGKLLPDGSVQAAAVSRSSNLDQAMDSSNTPDTPDNSIVGPVSRTADRYTGSRDINVLLSPGHQIVVHVPKAVHIIRDDRSVSLYDLGAADTVRVRGAYQGDGSFSATEVEVLHPAEP